MKPGNLPLWPSAVPQAVSDRERLYAVIAAAITPEQLAAVRETVRAVADPALRADMSDVLASQAAALGLL